MDKLKRIIKNFFFSTNTLFILDKINYLSAYANNFKKNKKFKKLNPDFHLPPDYYLYETYRLDYQQYKEDGALEAVEILEGTKKYLRKPIKVLEWGCGVARILRHLPEYIDKDSEISGVDINSEMIIWDKKFIPHVNFFAIDYNPPTSFSDHQFDLIFAFSVFTHIEADLQSFWVKEIHRIIANNGVFLFTTHGKKYKSNLTTKDVSILQSKGAVTKLYKQKGHRMMTTYNDYKHFLQMIEPLFDLLEYYDGEENPNKSGGQDLWVVRKK